MLGLGLSLTSPLRILSSGGVTPPAAEEFQRYQIGDPGPSTNDIALTETFYEKVVDLGGGKYRIHTYEFFIPNLPDTYNIYLRNFTQIYWSVHNSVLDDVDAVTSIGAEYSAENVSNFAIATDDIPILDGEPGETVFKKFMQYLYTDQTNEFGANYTGREFLFANGIAGSGRCFRSYQAGNTPYTGNVSVHEHTFYEFFLNIFVNAYYPEYSNYLEFLNSDEYPGFNPEFSFSFDALETALAGYAIYFRVNTVTVTESVSQPALVQLPQFGDAPELYTLVSGNFVLNDSAGGTFTLQSGEAVFGNVPSTSPTYTMSGLTINESYLEIGDTPIAGTDLYPLGMHTDGTTPITSFETHFQITYTNTTGGTTTFPAVVEFTNAGSITSTIGTTIIKTFAYQGTLVITEEEFPGLYSSLDNGVYGIPITISNIFNTVPNSNIFTSSNITADPFTGTQLYIPVLGTTQNDFLVWLSNLPGDVPGTSLSVIPATNSTYDATPPNTNPTITSYNTAAPLKGSHVDFAAGTADLSTAYATSGTDFTFIAIGINKNVANATEQLVVNRKTTTEGVGIRSDNTYIKLKNASLPIDTTPVGVPSQDYQDYVPFFTYLEKTSTTASEYNEFNEQVKRYSVGANDILELDRITNNFAGSLSYIEVIDKALSATERAKKIEHLRVKYLDLNTPNRYE